MATREQYEFFRVLYEEEEWTSLQLEGRAKVYLSVITAFQVTLVLKANDALSSVQTLGIPWWCMMLEAVILGIALILVVLAIRIRTYEAVNDGVDIIEGYGNVQPTNEEFFEDRIVDYAVASSRNRTINNQVASVLSWAGWTLVTGMILLLLFVTMALGGRI